MKTPDALHVATAINQELDNNQTMKKEQDTKTTLKESGFIADDAYFNKARD